MKASADTPSSPKYSVSTPSRLGHPDVKISKKDKKNSLSADKELYSFFVINPSYDPSAEEEIDDKSVQFMFVGRPKIDAGAVQGRHIHAYALYKEAIYSALEDIDILKVPEVLHKFLEQHAHFYNASEAKIKAYEERVTGFNYQTIDDDSASASADAPGFSETTTQQQRKDAEALDERMFAYFDKKYHEIFSSRSISEEEEVGDLTPDEEEIISIYTSFVERQSYLCSKDIRSNMKDAEYISICSRMNMMVSEAIEIINGMPGIAFHHGSSKGSGEKDAMRRLREQNELEEEYQDLEVIALNMARLIDFPVEYFHNKEDYSLKEVLDNHISLIEAAFPRISINHELIEEFIREFNKRDPMEVLDEETDEIDKIEWSDCTVLDVVLDEILYDEPGTSPSASKVVKMASASAVKQH